MSAECERLFSSGGLIIIIIIINPFYMLYKSVTIVAWQGSPPAFLLSYLTRDMIRLVNNSIQLTGECN